MNKCRATELAKDDAMGSILRCGCKQGIVHIRCNGISIDLTDDDFLVFVSLVKKASSRLLNQEEK